MRWLEEQQEVMRQRILDANRVWWQYEHVKLRQEQFLIKMARKHLKWYDRILFWIWTKSTKRMDKIIHQTIQTGMGWSHPMVSAIDGPVFGVKIYDKVYWMDDHQYTESKKIRKDKFIRNMY